MSGTEKTFKCLNPTGIQIPIDTFPLAPRLDTLDGKEIYISINGEPDITIALERKLKSDYPNVSWKVKKSQGVAPNPLSSEEMKTCDALIEGVAL